MAESNRRDFLNLVGVVDASTSIGCSSESARNLIAYIITLENIIRSGAT
jgi:hypothetical protein